MDERVLNIFVLEDNLQRIKWFRQIFNDCNLFFTDNIKIACDEIRTKDYDIIFLDRDLGYPKTETGEDVARVMKEENLAKNSCVVVHTSNPIGRESIKKYLEEYHSNFHIIDFIELVKMKRKDFLFIS